MIMSTVQAKPPPKPEERIPREIVIAGIHIPLETLWKWWLRIKKDDINRPYDPKYRILAIYELCEFVTPFGFRVTVYGEAGEPEGHILVTQSKWFMKGYLGMPEGEIPYYTCETKYEKRARLLLKKCGEYIPTRLVTTPNAD